MAFEPQTKAGQTTEELETPEDVYYKQLKTTVYTLWDRVKTLEEELERYREVLSQKDELIEQLIAEKQGVFKKFELVQEGISNDVCPVQEINPRGESHTLTYLRLQLSENEKAMFRMNQELENEKANCKKQQEKHEKELLAVRKVARDEEAELHAQELETVKAELERVTRDRDETVNNLEKKLEDVETKYQMQILELTEQYEDSEPANARLSVKDDMIISLKNKLQKKEDIIKKEAARFYALEKMNETLKEAADREEKTRVLLQSELETEKAKIDTLSGDYEELFYQWLALNDKHTSLNETMRYQKGNNRKLEESLRLTKLEADRYKQELFICTEDFEKAFPHASHNKNPAFRQFRTKFLAMKKKYLQGGTLSQSEKEALEIVAEYLQEKLKQSEQRVEGLLKEVEKQKRNNAADRTKYLVSLTDAQTHISEWGNSLLKEDVEQKHEIGRLKGQVKALQFELKKRKEEARLR